MLSHENRSPQNNQAKIHHSCRLEKFSSKAREMDPTFFGNSHWYAQPEPTRPSRPVHSTGQPIQGPARRVVRIPVHYVGSEPVNRSGSALKIQKVFRGFLTRKSLNKIRDIKAKVDEIGERLQRDEDVELIRSDKKERLRMNETLMSLLLKLDSICGLDFGVRLCRKAVIREAIALQDRIDAVAAAADSVSISDSVDRETEISVCSETVVSEQTDISESCGNLMVENARNPEDPIECWEMFMDESCVSEGRDASEEAEVIDVGVDVEFNKADDNEAKDGKLDEYSSPVATDEEECGNGNDSNREFLELMMANNEKMMRMMEQLSERSESQTRMLNALTHRVELLENAFLCERLTLNKEKRKREKKKMAAAAVN